MERLHWKFILAFFLLSGFLAASGCKDRDDDPDDPSTEVDSGTVKMHLHNYVEENEVELYGAVYETAAQLRKISVTIAQLFLSDIRLVTEDGKEQPISGKVVLKLQTLQTYTLGKVPAGDYISVRFKLGLSPTLNALNPDESADSALLQHPEMWFGSTAQPDGYVFANFQGTIDTTAAASGDESDMQPFAYKIGTNARYIEVSMPDQAFVVEKDRTEYLHLIIDWYKLFAGITLSDPANLSLLTSADNASSLGTRLANNIPAIFEYEE